MLAGHRALGLAVFWFPFSFRESGSRSSSVGLRSPTRRFASSARDPGRTTPRGGAGAASGRAASGASSRTSSTSRGSPAPTPPAYCLAPSHHLELTFPLSSPSGSPRRVRPPRRRFRDRRHRPGAQAEAGTFNTAWWMASVMVMSTEYDCHRPRRVSQATNSWVSPLESVRISAWRPRRNRFGSWARSGVVASMWSAAVLEPALPGRSEPTTARPAAAVVDETHQPVVAHGLLPGRAGVLLPGVSQDKDLVDVHDHLPDRVRRYSTGQLPDVFAYVGVGSA